MFKFEFLFYHKYVSSQAHICTVWRVAVIFRVSYLPLERQTVDLLNLILTFLLSEIAASSKHSMAMKVEPDTNARHDFQIREQSGFFFSHLWATFILNLLNNF
jgi:hypothetical protein